MHVTVQRVVGDSLGNDGSSDSEQNHQPYLPRSSVLKPSFQPTYQAVVDTRAERGKGSLWAIESLANATVYKSDQTTLLFNQAQ